MTTTTGVARPPLRADSVTAEDISLSPAGSATPVRAPARVLTLAWLGVMAIAGFSCWLAVVGTTALAQSRDLGAAFARARGVDVGPVLIAAVVVLFLAERRWPAVRRPALARAHVIDAGYFALFAVFIVPVLTVVQTGFGVEVERHASFLLLARLPTSYRWAVILLTLVGIDLMKWVAHVANHRSMALWRLHALHHSQEDMSVLTTFRTHPVMHAAYLPALIPALMLGSSGGAGTTGLIIYGCLVTLPHANLRWSFGPLGRVFVSPVYHRTHHARELGGNGTVNFGFVLSVWDQLAGTAELPVKGEPIATGLAQRPVPVEQSVTSKGLAGLVLAQLAQPFHTYSRTDWRRG